MIVYNRVEKVYQSNLFEGGGLYAAFGTRLTGDGRDNQVIRNFLLESGITYNTLIDPEQVHSSNLLFWDQKTEKETERIEETDGLLTDKKNIVLSVITADCPPIVFYESKTGVVGISHQGWRGSLKNLPVKMITKMKEEGAAVDSIKVAIGPSIGECCYDVDDDLYYEFLDAFEELASQVFTTKKGRKHLNLTKLNFLLLTKAGIRPSHIDFFPFCTHCNEAMFFSHRRSKVKNNDFPRQFSVIVNQ